MQRRNFIKGGIVFGASAVPGWPAFSQPCPPQNVSVDGVASTDEANVSCPPQLSNVAGLDFPGSTWQNSGACRFTFHDPLPAYPATYIWECLPRKQKGFYTTFFWGPDGSPGADDFYPDKTYYGAHPYPDPRGSWDAFQEPPELDSGEGHVWEIAVEGGDVKGARVAYNRWHIQVLRVKNLSSNRRYHEYFTDVMPGWDPAGSMGCLPLLPSTANVRYNSVAFDDPPSPGLVWGDAPWTVAHGNEVFDGVIRGIRVYNAYLSDQDILSEICNPMSTANGIDNIWYLKMNPTPDDLSCDSIPGRSSPGPTPVWSTARRPVLWEA